MGFKMTQFLQEALLRKHEVIRLLGICNSTFYARIQAGIIKPGVPMGPRLKGWPRSEIQEYIASCIAARDTTGSAK